MLNNFVYPHIQIDYNSNRYIHIKQFISQNTTQLFLKEALESRGRRVICGIPDVNWMEHYPAQDSKLNRFFNNEDMITWVKEVLKSGDSTFEKLETWVSRYKVGEYINPHVDKTGTTQLLICLMAPRKDNGGELTLENKAKQTRIFLNPGDALLFEATYLRHYTTPLKSTVDLTEPERIVAVARYFFSG